MIQHVDLSLFLLSIVRTMITLYQFSSFGVNRLQARKVNSLSFTVELESSFRSFTYESKPFPTSVWFRRDNTKFHNNENNLQTLRTTNQCRENAIYFTTLIILEGTPCTLGTLGQETKVVITAILTFLALEHSDTDNFRGNSVNAWNSGVGNLSSDFRNPDVSAPELSDPDVSSQKVTVPQINKVPVTLSLPLSVPPDFSPSQDRLT